MRTPRRPNLRAMAATGPTVRRVLALVPALFAAAAALPAAEEAPRARFTFGSLAGKRQMLQDRERLYWLTPGKELCIAAKPRDLPSPREPGGGEARSAAPLGKVKLEGIPEALEWIDERTVCAATGSHLVFVDVGDPARPRLRGELAVAAREILGASELRRAGRSLLVAARRQGLLRVDLSDPAKPRKAAALPLRGWALGLDVEGDLAVVAAGVGLAFVRVEGEALRLESEYDTLRRAELVRIRGKRLAVAAKEYTVFYDISDPRRPVELGEVPNRDPFFYSHNMALHLDDRHVWLAASEGGLYVYDWTDPRAPRLLVQHSFWGNERRLTLEGKLGYLQALGIQGTKEELARLLPRAENLRISALGMAVDGDRVYLADEQGRLWALEVDLGASPSARVAMRPE